MQLSATVCRQILSSLCANLMTTSQGTAGAWFSANFLALQRPDTPLACGPLSLHEAALVVSIIYVGAIIGNLSAPHLVRKFGSKRVLLAIAYPQIMFWMLTIYAQNVYYLYLRSILEGFIAACLVVSVSIFSIEISHDNTRGAINAIHDPAYYLGSVTTFILANHFNTIDQAKILVVIPIAFVILFVWIPQTPQHLINVDNRNAAIEANKFFKGTDLDVKNDVSHLETQELIHNTKITLSDFTNRRSRRAIRIAFPLLILFTLQGMSVLLTYVTEVFSSTNSDISPQHASTITTIMVMIGSLIFMNLVERINRRTLYICSASATALGLTLFAVYLHFLADNAAFNWFPVVCVPCVLFANCLGLAPVTWLVILEIMPKKIKEFGYSSCNLIILVIQFIFTQSYPLMKVHIGLIGWIIIFAVSCFCSALFGYYRLPETRGKSHEEIMQTLDK